MEKFLGVLFCGGRGKRLGELAKFVSKSFIPVYDKPVFMFGLDQLRKSKLVDEIILLTNVDNDAQLKKLGYRTIVQNDKIVNDMFSGWEYVKKVTGTNKHGVLIPSDNISEADIDSMIIRFRESGKRFMFLLKKNISSEKLSDMGSFDLKRKKYFYRKSNSSGNYGVTAPYIITNDLKKISVPDIFENDYSGHLIYRGVWFDLGDYRSILEAARWRRKKTTGL